MLGKGIGFAHVLEIRIVHNWFNFNKQPRSFCPSFHLEQTYIDCNGFVQRRIMERGDAPLENWGDFLLPGKFGGRFPLPGKIRSVRRKSRNLLAFKFVKKQIQKNFGSLCTQYFNYSPPPLDHKPLLALFPVYYVLGTIEVRTRTD